MWYTMAAPRTTSVIGKKTPPKVVVTNRKLRNTEIGIDVSVPSHEYALTPKLVKSYHVVVITSLPHFKSAIHSENDVVQFMVLCDYEAFEQLQKDVIEQFPELKLPNLPRKFHIFLKDADIEERQIAFDCLLKVLSRSKTIFTSAVLLQFFGFDPLADQIYFKTRREYLQRMEDDRKLKEKDNSAVDVDVSLFKSDAVMDSIDKSYSSKEYATKSLFDDDSVTATGRREAKVHFLEDDLFISTEQSDTGEINENSEHAELLDVSEGLDDVLQNIGPASKSTPSTRLSGIARDINFGGHLLDEKESVDATHMETDDILKYIQSNTEERDDDLDLF